MIKLLLFTLLLIPISRVDAFYCSNSELIDYKKYSDNITYRYDYVEQNNTVTFNVTISNLTPGIYLLDENNQVRYDYTGNDIVINNIQSGQSVYFSINVASGSCLDENLNFIRLQLPTYNPYYQDKVCEGYEYYKLCDKWSTHGLTYEKFLSNMEEYKKSLIVIPEEEIIPPEDITVWDRIAEFLLSYYHIILITIIVLCSIKIYKENKDSNIYK